ncbi:WXG100 family type VII secretion target [Mycobacterium sp. SMC-4]|uniref:WXG100 family type VII secretion target n=1 Tax=Mycobacterium sp. SMC-4 TaxID=2857059 RepID=UPI0021B15D04|nr:WXG100 family type VII secretion target [Mycobacterium sp. SMC-4]UXA18811.1 WXG100 family type VII secretion target [Mycobacterium sp. SMC-4]
MDHLRVDPDVAFATSRSLGNEAVELHEQLTGLQRDWDNLSRGWTGAASSAYAPWWAQWFDGATTLVNSLEDLSRKVATAAAHYAGQDSRSAESIDSAATPLGL